MSGPLVAVAAAAAGFGLFRAPAPPPRRVVAAAPAARPAELAALRHEVVMLRKDVATLGQLVDGRERKPAAPRVRSPRGRRSEAGGGDPTAREALASEIAEHRSLARVAAIERRLGAEPVDPVWAIEAGDAIRTALDHEDLADAWAHDVDCRSTLCVVGVTHPDADGSTAFEQRLPVAVAEVLPRLAMHRVEHDDGSVTTLAYLARIGHRVPMAEGGD